MREGIQSSSSGTLSKTEQRSQEESVLRRMQEDPVDTRLPHCEPIPLTVPDSVPPEIHSSPQIVIAHRGASAHLPEHSLAGYRLALELGADYIEPDLLATKDHHLVAMHSMDLTVTTNVEEVFGASRNKTYSKFRKDMLEKMDDGSVSDVDAYGYWVYDFTLAELKQLRLKQRLGGPENSGRSTVFDGLFQIPTLTEILELLNNWNEQIQPLWFHDDSNFIGSNEINNDINKPYRYTSPPRGLYAELKDSNWFTEDAGINLVDLFFDHIRDKKSVWDKALLNNMCHTKRLREHEYKLPPLVMQAFEEGVLENFTNRWNEHAEKISTNNESTKATKPVLSLTSEITLDSTNATTHIPLPRPPTILLVNHKNCQEATFFDNIEHNYRHVISGIGPDKRCFFKAIDEREAQPVFQYEPTVMEWATKLKLEAVHPWTERPEQAFLATSTEDGTRRRELADRNTFAPFENVIEELMFLKCTVGVQGVFSESVDTAVRAMGMACPNTKHSRGKGSSSSGGSSSSSADITLDDIPMGPVIGLSFVSGILVALVAFHLVCGKKHRTSNSGQPQNPAAQRRRAPRIPGRRVSNLGPHSALPTGDAFDDEDDDVVVLDDNDREML